MSIIKQGILGGFSGKTGAITGASWKGRSLIRSNNNCGGQKHSVKQIGQHLRMLRLSIFYKFLRGSILSIHYSNVNKKLTFCNNIYSHFNKGFDDTNRFSFFRCDLINGSFLFAGIPVYLEYNNLEHSFVFNLTNYDYSDLSNDVEMYGLIYDFSKQDIVMFQRIEEFNVANRCVFHYVPEYEFKGLFQFIFFTYDKQHNVFSNQKFVQRQLNY